MRVRPPPRPHVSAPRALTHAAPRIPARARRLRPAQEEPAARDAQAAERKPGRSRSRRCRCRFAGDGIPLGGRFLLGKVKLRWKVQTAAKFRFVLFEATKTLALACYGNTAVQEPDMSGA